MAQWDAVSRPAEPRGWHGEPFAASCAEVYGRKFLKSEFYSVLNPVSFATGQNLWFGQTRSGLGSEVEFGGCTLDWQAKRCRTPPPVIFSCQIWGCSFCICLCIIQCGQRIGCQLVVSAC